MSQPLELSAVAGIWIVIKRPQECWIHNGQRDATDHLAARSWLIAVLAALAALTLAIGW